MYMGKIQAEVCPGGGWPPGIPLPPGFIIHQGLVCKVTEFAGPNSGLVTATPYTGRLVVQVAGGGTSASFGCAAAVSAASAVAIGAMLYCLDPDGKISEVVYRRELGPRY